MKETEDRIKEKIQSGGLSLFFYFVPLCIVT